MTTSLDKNPYPYVLDHKPRFFLGWFLYRLFRRVHIDENMTGALKGMHKQGTVVYAIKYRGQLDYLLYHYNFRRRRLPYPKIAFGLNISLLLPFSKFLRVFFHYLSSLLRKGHFPNPYTSGFYKKAIQEGTTSLVFLVDPKGFLKRFVHGEKGNLEFLLETQKEMERPIFVVPQLVLYKRTPEKSYTTLSSALFGFKDHPGVIRKIALFFRHNRRAVIDFGEPLNLQEYLEHQPTERPMPDTASEVRRMLVDRIDSQKRIVLGPIMKSRQQYRELVLMDPKVREAIDKQASKDKKKRRHTRKKAGEYFDEIAADYNVSYVQSFYIALTWFWNKIFKGIEVDRESLAKVREWARRGTLVYVPSHKSHIDYLILNYILFGANMHTPRIAAGTNLAFWPMGYIFRKSGAFFIRRTFRRARLYMEVFNRYIKALLQEGSPIEFFIEGGRSRNGKLVRPKTGFLAILLQAYREGFCDDLIFVPASIGYDRILEEKSYLKELGGGEKKQENITQIIKARRFLKKRYGKIYVHFSEPFSLREYLTGRDPAAANAHKELAFHLVRAINAVSPVSPLSLVATAILANHRKGFYLSELDTTVNTLLGFLKRQEAPIAGTLEDASKAVQETISLLIAWKIVGVMEDAPSAEDTFCFVDDEKKLELEYYKNNIIHFFIPHALVAVSLLTGTEEIKEMEQIADDYGFLKWVFKKEFVFEENEDPRESVSAILECLKDSSYVVDSGGGRGYQVTKLGLDKLPIWAALAKTYLESYWVASRALIQQYKKGDKGEDVLKNMNYLGKRYQKQGTIEHIGALSQLNFKNAAAFFQEKVIKAKTDNEQPSPVHEKLSQVSQRLYKLSNYRS